MTCILECGSIIGFDYTENISSRTNMLKQKLRNINFSPVTVAVLSVLYGTTREGFLNL